MEKIVATQGTQVLNIPYPPKEIFKFDYNIVAPAQGVLKENSTFVVTEIKCIYGEGIFAYFQGVPYPSKCFPFPEAIYAVNMAKRVTRFILKMFSPRDLILPLIGFALTRRKTKMKIVSQFLWSYRDTVDKSLEPYYLKDGFYANSCREIRKFVTSFLTHLGIDNYIADRFSEAITVQVEYDNAYRYRIEDAASETTKEKLLKNPHRELKNLAKILREREPEHIGDTADKFEKIAKALSWALYIPSIRRAFNKALQESDFEKFQLDEADRYHVLLWSDYNFLGKTIHERLTIYHEIHKNGQPPRVTYKPAK